MARMLESSGISGYIHMSQKKIIMDKIEDKIKNKKQNISSEAFWLDVDDTKLAIVKKQSKLKSNDKKWLSYLKSTQKEIDECLQKQRDNEHILHMIDPQLDYKLNKLIQSVSKMVLNKTRDINKSILVSEYWKPKDKRTPDSKILTPYFGPSKIESILELSPSSKIDVIVKNATTHIHSAETYKGSNLLVIASQYVFTLQVIQEHFGNDVMKLYHGGLLLSQRQKMLKEFHEGKFKILGLSKQSGGTGLNIGKSKDGKVTVRTMYIVEPSESSSLEEQLKARLLRLGMGGTVSIVKYVYEGNSMDRYMMESQLHKEKIAHSV